VVFLIDVSRSMAAVDAVPDRLGVAVESARLILNALGALGDDSRAGIVAFAGEGVVRCPLTSNLGAVAEALGRLQPGSVRPGGTNLGAGCAAACRMLEAQAKILPGRQSIVLISDGEDLAGSLNDAIESLRGRGILLHAIAVGDAGSGHPIPWPLAARDGGGGGSLQFQGQTVLTRRDDEGLRQLALSTGGAMLPLGLSTPVGLDRLFSERLATIPAPGPAEGRGLGLPLGDRRELAPAISFLALAVAILAASWRRSKRSPGVLLLLGGVATVSLVAAQTPPKTNASAHVAAAMGDEAAALAAFARESQAHPRAALPRFNAAAVLFRMKRFAEAEVWYREARDRADVRLQPRADFALGNTALALGRAADALAHYDACLASKASGDDLDALREAAAENRAYTEQLLNPPKDTPPRDDSGGEAPDDSDTSMPESPDSGQPETSKRSDPAPDAPGSTPPDALDPSPGLNESAPEEQLESAVERIERARSRRIAPTEADASPPNVTGERDW
jgi:Ca-activated chloride channel family protein